MIRKINILPVVLSLLFLPATASAYISPEDVLLNRELYIPPSSREAQARSNIQAEESAARREREQERAYELQHPVADEEPVTSPTENMHSAAPTVSIPAGYILVPTPQAAYPSLYTQPLYGAVQQYNTDAAQLQAARTARLIQRVNENQYQSQVLHSGAPDLAPTGAGSATALAILLAAVGYTIWRSGNSKAIALQ